MRRLTTRGSVAYGRHWAPVIRAAATYVYASALSAFLFIFQLNCSSFLTDTWELCVKSGIESVACSICNKHLPSLPLLIGVLRFCGWRRHSFPLSLAFERSPAKDCPTAALVWKARSLSCASERLIHVEAGLALRVKHKCNFVFSTGLTHFLISLYFQDCLSPDDRKKVILL